MLIATVGVAVAFVLALLFSLETRVRMHERPAIFGSHDDCFTGGLPFRALLFRLGQLHDVRRGMAQSHQPAPIR